MKIIKGIFFAFLALILVLGTAIFIFSQVFEADQYLPQITQQASIVLGRGVSIGHLGLGFSLKGITLDAWPVAVADDPAFIDKPFIEIEKVRVRPDFKSLLIGHKFRIGTIVLVSPQVHFIRSEQGVLNSQSMGRLTAVSPSVALSLSPLEEKKSSSAPVQVSSKEQVSLPVVNVEIRDGAVSFIDQSQSVPLDLWLEHINGGLNGFSMSNAFTVSLKACFYAPNRNVLFKARVSLDASNRSAVLSDLNFLADFSGLDMERINDISPDESVGDNLKNITGQLQLNLDRLDIASSGMLDAKGQVDLTGGIIKNFNIIGNLTQSLSSFGSLADHVNNVFQGPLKGLMREQDTEIQKAQVKGSYHDETFFVDDSTLETDTAELSAKGTIGQSLKVDLQTQLHLSDTVTSALVSEFKGFQALCDDSNRISVDAGLQGVFPHLKYKPTKDFRKKLKKVLMEEGGNILSVLLGGGR